MKLIGIDVGKNSHHFCIMDKETGELNVTPTPFPPTNIKCDSKSFSDHSIILKLYTSVSFP